MSDVDNQPGGPDSPTDGENLFRPEDLVQGQKSESHEIYLDATHEKEVLEEEEEKEEDDVIKTFVEEEEGENNIMEGAKRVAEEEEDDCYMTGRSPRKDARTKKRKISHEEPGEENDEPNPKKLLSLRPRNVAEIENEVMSELESAGLTSFSSDVILEEAGTSKPRKKAPRSVLSVGGEVGRKIRDNFARLTNKGGPAFLTCKQCIVQVNRARVFRDDRRELSHLLCHLQLHEDVIKGVEDQESVKKARDEFDENMRNAGQRKRKGQPEVTINKVGKEWPKTKEKPVVLDEDYNCILCKLTFPTFEDFISHSVSEHNRTTFNVTFKDDEKDAMEKVVRDDASLSPVAIDDDDAKIRQELAETSQKLAKRRGREYHHSVQKLDFDTDEIRRMAEDHVMVITREDTSDDDNDDARGLNDAGKSRDTSPLPTDDNVVNASELVFSSEVVVVSNKKLRAAKRSKKKPKVKVEFIGVQGEGQQVPTASVAVKTEEAIGPFICIECGTGTKDCSALREHMTNMHGDRSRIFACKRCDKSFSEKNFNQFEQHMMENHPNEDIACYFCILSFKKSSDLRYHVAQHRPPLNFCCPYCYHEFSWILEAEFTNHVLSHVEEDKPFQCNECQEHFPDFLERREHQVQNCHDKDLRKFHDELRAYVCTGCGKQFANTTKTPGVRALKQHMCSSGVTMDPRFECKYCKCLFPLARALRNHMRQKHENHMCHVCGLVCKSKPALDEHVGSEHFDSQFPCPICLETFDTSQKMKQHRTREHGARNFICEFCGQGFAAKLLLVRHLKKHDEFKGFTCNVCGDKFMKADRLENHFRKYHSHVVTDQEYTVVLDNNLQTALAAETIAIIQQE